MKCKSFKQKCMSYAHIEDRVANVAALVESKSKHALWLPTLVLVKQSLYA